MLPLGWGDKNQLPRKAKTAGGMSWPKGSRASLMPKQPKSAGGMTYKTWSISGRSSETGTRSTHGTTPTQSAPPYQRDCLDLVKPWGKGWDCAIPRGRGFELGQIGYIPFLMPFLCQFQWPNWKKRRGPAGAWWLCLSPSMFKDAGTFLLSVGLIPIPSRPSHVHFMSLQSPRPLWWGALIGGQHDRVHM